MRARAGGFALAARHDPMQYTAKARATFQARFLDQVDPERQLPEPERERRAEAARRLYYVLLSLKSARNRRLAPEKKIASTSRSVEAIQEAMNGGSSTARSSV
jgi:hypothetical protein